VQFACFPWSFGSSETPHQTNLAASGDIWIASNIKVIKSNQVIFYFSIHFKFCSAIVTVQIEFQYNVHILLSGATCLACKKKQPWQGVRFVSAGPPW
jgi:hypothetical protein